MRNRLCKWFGCNADKIRWISANRVKLTCTRCGVGRIETRR